MYKDLNVPTPLNLKDLYGNRYKVTLDESSTCPGESKRDPWYFRIPCKYGHIYPISDKYLGFWCDSGVIKARMVREAPEIELVQDGDGEGVFRFTVEQFEIVAEYTHPFKKRGRRNLSNMEKSQLVEAGRDHQFSLGFTGKKRSTESTEGI